MFSVLHKNVALANQETFRQVFPNHICAEISTIYSLTVRFAYYYSALRACPRHRYYRLFRRYKLWWHACPSTYTKDCLLSTASLWTSWPENFLIFARPMPLKEKPTKSYSVGNNKFCLHTACLEVADEMGSSDGLLRRSVGLQCSYVDSLCAEPYLTLLFTSHLFQLCSQLSSVWPSRLPSFWWSRSLSGILSFEWVFILCACGPIVTSNSTGDFDCWIGTWIVSSN